MNLKLITKNQLKKKQKMWTLIRLDKMMLKMFDLYTYIDKYILDHLAS